MSGLGPQTQAGGFNFANSQLDSQPNYSFADLTQDGASYDGFADFSGLTQVLITGLRHAGLDVPTCQHTACVQRVPILVPV